MALGDVMRDLPHRPSAVAVGGFDLLRRQTLHRGTHGRGSLRDLVDQFVSLLLVRRTGKSKFSDGITRIAHHEPPEGLAGESTRAAQLLCRFSGETRNGELRSGEKFKDSW